jgi:hypothetical protein
VCVHETSGGHTQQQCDAAGVVAVPEQAKDACTCICNLDGTIRVDKALKTTHRQMERERKRERGGGGKDGEGARRTSHVCGGECTKTGSSHDEGEGTHDPN